ncbi:MAG: glycoside hydrolase family 2 protein [Candidatus Jordarchaeum sp.]|uniref:glycoside hydrolase family 2 protein n=1 Tax=Candidatus Jordarchaeum sp. TaxID=2823881 RepID=UPI004049200B
MEFKLKTASETIPQGIPVTEHSVFTPVSEAVSITNIKIMEPVDYGDSNYQLIDLGGVWRRLADRGDLGNSPSKPDFDDFDWPQVKVPNNFGLDGELQRFYDPVWYRRVIRVKSFNFADLIFEGVDYLADVHLNGEHLGHHEGYFAPFSFDISKKLKEKNILAIKVQDPCENLDPTKWFFQQYKKYIKGTMNYHDSRPGGLPGTTSPRWSSEWGQSLTTGGITQPVYLKFTGPVRIDKFFATPLDLKGRVHLAIVATNRQENQKQTAFNIHLYIPIKEKESKEKKHVVLAFSTELEPGPNRIDLELLIPEPALWWPCSHGELGEPVTYGLTIEAVCEKILSDRIHEHFGIRTVHLDHDPWVFNLNERPIFIKATNYIPRQHFADVDYDFYHQDMQMVKKANLNSVGIHAHIQCPPCYEATDDVGIMVFQDFPLQWAYDSGEKTNPGFVEKAQKMIAEMAYHLYNHASVVYYACHNEPPAQFYSGFEAEPDEDKGNLVLDEKLQQRLQEVEQSRPVHRSSGIGEDLHVYDGSLNGGSLYDCRQRKSGFVSEYGFWSIAENAVKYGDTGWPPDEDQLIEWSSRLSFFGSTCTFTGAPNRYPSLIYWIVGTQLYGAFLAKYQTEFFRSRRGQPYNAIRWHFFSDWWPEFGYAGGGLVDAYRNPKLAYKWLTQAQRPLIMIADLENTVFPPGTELKIPIYMVNDNLSIKTGKWQVELNRVSQSIVIEGDPEAAKLGGTTLPASERHLVAIPAGETREKLLEQEGEFQIQPETVKKIITITFTTPPEAELKSYTLTLKWKEESGLKERNWAHILVAPNDWSPGPGMHLITSP